MWTPEARILTVGQNRAMVELSDKTEGDISNELQHAQGIVLETGGPLGETVGPRWPTSDAR
jgi:hypothetical protein